MSLKFGLFVRTLQLFLLLGSANAFAQNQWTVIRVRVPTPLVSAYGLGITGKITDASGKEIPGLSWDLKKSIPLAPVANERHIYEWARSLPKNSLITFKPVLLKRDPKFAYSAARNKDGGELTDGGNFHAVAGSRDLNSRT
jgi:hypothetical protein